MTRLSFLLPASVSLMVLLAGCGGALTPSPSVSPSPTTARPAAKPSLSPATMTAAPRATASPSAMPTASLTPAPLTVVVGNTSGEGAFIRKTPALADRIRAWQDGTEMLLVGADQLVDGKTWRNVRDPAGNVGWIPAEFLIGTPAHTLAPTPLATPTLVSAARAVTAPVTTTITATVTATRTPPTSPDPRSAGLGIYCPDWEQMYGRSVKGQSCGDNLLEYDEGRYVIGWAGAQPSPTAYRLERLWRDEVTVPIDTAWLEARRLMPVDAIFERTYLLDDGDRVDVYSSAWLKPRIDSRLWQGGEPGTFSVVYRGSSQVRGENKTGVFAMILSVGRGP